MKKWYFILPTIGFLGVVVIFPMIWSLYLSLFNWKAAVRMPMKFIGLDNYYVVIFKDARFWNAVRFTLVYVGTAVSIELALGLGLAGLLNKPRKGTAFFKRVFLLPMVFPPIAVAFLWRMLLQPDLGAINKILVKFGIPGVPWTSSRYIAPFVLVLVDVWQWTPFMLLAILAGYQSLPAPLYEAAHIDGASGRQAFVYITLPLLKPLLTTLVLLRTIDAFKLFDLIWGITGGGPGSSTESLSYYIYMRGLSHFDMGYASAMSWLFLIIILFISIFLLNNLRKKA